MESDEFHSKSAAMRAQVRESPGEKTHNTYPVHLLPFQSKTATFRKASAALAAATRALMKKKVLEVLPFAMETLSLVELQKMAGLQAPDGQRLHGINEKKIHAQQQLDKLSVLSPFAQDSANDSSSPLQPSMLFSI